MYRLDLETLLLVLRTHSGQLEAFIASIPELRGPCQALVSVENGKIVACRIRDERGGELSGERAFQHLQKKVLEWNYQERPASTGGNFRAPLPEQSAPPPIQYSPRLQPENEYSPRLHPGNEYSPRFNTFQGQESFNVFQAIPVRVRRPDPQQFQAWTRQQRSIYNLIDGTRSIATIAVLLNVDEASAASLIGEMVRYGLVRM